MEEIKCKQVATLRGGKWEKTYEESRRVYGVDGLAPTVHTQGGGNQETKILVRSAVKSGYETAEEGDSINVAYPNSKTRRGRVGKGVSQTILTDSEICIVEPLAYDEQNGILRRDGTVGTLTTDGFEYAGVGVHPISKKLEFDGYKDTACPTLLATDWKCPKTVLEEKVEPIVYDGFNGKVRTDSSTIGTITRNVGADLKLNGQGIIEPTIWGSAQEHCAVKKDGVCPTLTQAMGAGGGQIPMHNYDFRVRKLTERECFRLQGVKDTDFAKIRQNQSKSSCYHLAGDSITTSVLMALFGQMLGIDWRSKVDELVDNLKSD